MKNGAKIASRWGEDGGENRPLLKTKNEAKITTRLQQSGNKIPP